MDQDAQDALKARLKVQHPIGKAWYDHMSELTLDEMRSIDAVTLHLRKFITQPGEEALKGSVHPVEISSKNVRRLVDDRLQSLKQSKKGKQMKQRYQPKQMRYRAAKNGLKLIELAVRDIFLELLYEEVLLPSMRRSILLGTRRVLELHKDQLEGWCRLHNCSVSLVSFSGHLSLQSFLGKDKGLDSEGFTIRVFPKPDRIVISTTDMEVE